MLLGSGLFGSEPLQIRLDSDWIFAFGTGILSSEQEGCSIEIGSLEAGSCIAIKFYEFAEKEILKISYRNNMNIDYKMERLLEKIVPPSEGIQFTVISTQICKTVHQMRV